MAYDQGYQQQQQRPYNGPAAPRPPPQRQYPPGPAPPQNYGARQDYDQYQEGYDYGHQDYRDGGYQEDYGRRQDDYGQGPQYQNYPPRQDYYGQGPNGPGRGAPMPRGRGGPAPNMPRPGPVDDGRGPFPPRGGGPPRGGYPNGAPGRGRPGPLPRAATSDPSVDRGPRAMHPPPMSPQDTGFGGSPFPTFPGQQRKTDRDEEQMILQQMGGLDISNQAPRPPPGARGPMPPGGDGYGSRRPPQRGYTQGAAGAGYPDPHRGPDPGYGPPDDYREEGFGPPSRTMTMPTMDAGRDPLRQQLPPRKDSAPYAGGLPRGLPPRPSTATGTRGPPPQRMPPPPNGGPPYQQGSFQGGYDQGPTNDYQQPQRPVSYDDVFDNYYEPRQDYPPQNPPHARSDMPDFDAAAEYQPRSSLDQHMASGHQGSGYPQPGPSRVPELNKTKSQPDLRQPQAAVFEMAGDIPPMPPVNGQYQQPASRPGQYAPQGGYGPGQPLPLGAAPVRQGSGASNQSGSNPDTLPSHPTPVRPGLMPNSIASQMVNKPPPVRNYNGGGGSANGGYMPPPQATMSSAPVPLQVSPASNPAAQAPVTPELLERLRNTIKANPNDSASALMLAKKLVEAIDVLVPNLPDPRSRGRTRERYANDAHKILKKLASTQDSEAMFFMADCMGRGLFGEADNKEAFTLYQSAAKLGNAPAAYRTAVCCEIGHEEGGGTRKDPLKAIQWYRRAAMLGDTPGMYKVGMILLKGLLGQPKNPREAVGWLKRAAERADADNPHALHELGLLYESAQPNDAILRDEAYALQLFKQAADLGYKFSQFRLGCAFEYGLMGCPIDPRQSIMWYSKAATQEEHQSELALSGWYLTGSEGVLQQSDTEAYLWARKAAMAGLAKAEYAMGYFTEVGIGVPSSMEDAKRWYWRAAAQDFPKARDRLEDLKRSGKNGPRQRERISRSGMNKQQEGDCVVM